VIAFPFLFPWVLAAYLAIAVGAAIEDSLNVDNLHISM
jgi:hypothetical protein